MSLSHQRNWPAILLFALALFARANMAAPQSATSPAPAAGNSQADVQRELNRLNDALAEVRRDQINYRIERDILKDAYTSSYQAVSLILTMILGTFTLLGFFGLRSLSALRQEFKGELEQLRTARSELDRQLESLRREQAEAKTAVNRLGTESQDRDRRLRALEMREKAASLISAEAFQHALDYLAIGLDLVPNDAIMLNLRARCLGMLGRGSEAITSLEAALREEPDNIQTIQNLAEYYLIYRRFAEHERIVDLHRDVIQRRSPLLLWYFESMRKLYSNDVLGLKAHVSKLLTMAPQERGPKITGWNYTEARLAIAESEDLVGKKLFLSALAFLEGRTDGSALLAATATPETARQDAPSVPTLMRQFSWS